MIQTGHKLSLDRLTAVIGVRGLGMSCARLAGQSSRLLLGDISAEVLDAAAGSLGAEGYSVETCVIDISDAASVRAFAARAAALAESCDLILTAGLSGTMQNPRRILEVNLLGTIHVLDAFAPLVGRGCSAVLLASSAAYMKPVPAEIERLMALGSGEEILERVAGLEDAATGLGAYCLAKRANQLRVQACASAWAERGARINSVSPGIMATPMSAHERESGSAIDATALAAPCGRLGQPMDIAAAVVWLMSPQAGFVTGTDLLVDGGLTASIHWGPLSGAA